MNRKLIPELHDCLKLTTLQHNFSDFDRFLKYTPNTRTWKGVLQHHCKASKEGEESFPAWPTDIETLLLHIADGMSANFSRHTQNYKGETSFTLYKLWNSDALKEDKRLKEDKKIIELLKFYATDPTFEDLIKQYGYILKSRPEDAHAGMNITSLYTHLVLTGKFYNNLLFLNSNEVLIFFDDKSILEKIETIAKQNGLWLSATWVRKPLIEIKSSEPSKIAGNRSEHLYGILQSIISPPLCEICQMAPADKIWPSDYLKQFEEDTEVIDEGTENLCNNCFSIRNRPSKLKKLKKWTEAENVSVVWIKLNLNYDLLTKVLYKLYLDYLKKSNPKVRIEDAEVRFSLIYEFQQDYNEFLEELRNGLFESFGHDCVETILKDMFCLKIEKIRDVFKILNLLDKKLNSFFP